jgi:hypothetical protein
LEQLENRRVLCVDLDGVLNTFDEWRSPEFFHPVRPGAAEFLAALRQLQYKIVIFTVRYGPWVENWLAENGLGALVDEVTNVKPPAEAYIDDRAICFQGDFSDTLQRVVSFRPFWQR